MSEAPKMSVHDPGFGDARWLRRVVVGDDGEPQPGHPQPGIGDEIQIVLNGEMRRYMVTGIEPDDRVEVTRLDDEPDWV